MKKFFTLIALALCAQASMADTTIASYTFPDQKLAESGSATASGVAGTGCTIDYAKIGGVDSKSVDQFVVLETKYYHKLTNATSAWIKIKLTTGKFQAGDKFSATMFNGKASVDGFYFKGSGGTNNKQEITYSATEENVLNYTLTDNDINDDGSLTLYRVSSNCYVRHIEVNRPEGSQKTEATAEFAKAIVGFKSGEAAGQTVTTNSDGAVTYSSANTSVVTVDATSGALTAVAPGKTTIKANVASTDTYTSATATYTVYVLSNATGTLADPYLPTDFRFMVETYEGEAEDAAWGWVAGYVVGVFNSGENDVKIFSSSTTSTTTQGTIGIAASADEAVGKNCLAVQLLTDTQVRTDLNLKDNWDKMGTKVWVHGRASLFTQSEGAVIIYGMSGTDNYSLDGNEPVITAISRVEAQQMAANGEFFNLAGQRVAQPAKGLYIVNGKKVVVK